MGGYFGGTNLKMQSGKASSRKGNLSIPGSEKCKEKGLEVGTCLGCSTDRKNLVARKQ